MISLSLYIYKWSKWNHWFYPWLWTFHPCQGNSWCLCCLSSLARDWSHVSHMHCFAPDSATMGTPIVHPETLWEWQKLAESTWTLLELIWYVGISDHFGIRKTCRKLGLSQNEGWTNFTAIFMGATGSQKCNWSNPEARRTSASRSGHLWFSDFLQHLFQCCSISQQCQRFQKGSNRFPKNLSEQTGTIRHELAFWTLDLISTHFQIGFDMSAGTPKEGKYLWQLDWLGTECWLYKSKTYLPKDFVDFSILFPFYSVITGSTILQLFLHDRTRACPLISDWSMVLTFVRSPVPELIRGCSLFGGWHDRAIHGLRHCLLLHGVSGQELPGQRSKTWNLRISRPVASCTSTLVDHYIQMLDWLKQWLPKDYDYCMY